MTDSDGSGKEIWFVNRGLVLLRPRQPFVDWVIQTDPGTPVPEDLARDAVGAFLIPDFAMTADSYAWIRENFATMFEIQLRDWYMDPDMWPTGRDWETFNEWFEVEFTDITWDLVDAPLSSNPPESERPS